VLLAQTTVSQGSIQGTITDPSGAVVGGAKITITHKATAQVISTTSTSSGTYNSGGLIPGDYVLRAEAKGFRTAEQGFVVQVGVTSSGNIKLEVGEASQVVEVQANTIQVNTEQSTVQGVITGDQIDKLPSMAATSWISPSSNRACRFKTVRRSIPPRPAILRFPSTVSSDALRVSNLTAWTSAMKPSERPRRILG